MFAAMIYLCGRPAAATGGESAGAPERPVAAPAKPLVGWNLAVLKLLGGPGFKKVKDPGQSLAIDGSVLNEPLASRLPAGDGGGGALDLCADCLAKAIDCAGAAGGELSEASCRLGDGSYLKSFSFELTSARRVEIFLSSEAFDPYLFITDGSCLILDYNDDCAPDSPASCLTLALPAGKYFLAANSYTSRATGAFEIRLDCLGTPFIRGDMDGSGAVDLSDAINNLYYLFLGAFTPTCLDAADDDDSGVVDISDPIFSLKRLFLGDPPQPAPGPISCGMDPTEDILTCEAFSQCK